MTKTDRALLKLAAQADGRKWKWVTCPKYRHEVPGMLLHDGINEVDYYPGWNPLEDDGNALRLAVLLGLEVYHSINYDVWTVFVGYPLGGRVIYVSEEWGADQYAATRRAIVRAAAEIGRKS